MAIPISYNVRNVLQRPVSTLTTAVGVGLTVAIFIGSIALVSGFRAAMLETGSPANAIALRKGADSEISSGIGRDAANILRALADVAPGPDGRPLASPELVVVTNRERLGQPGSSNVNVRGVDASALALRDHVKIVEGRMFAPGTDEVIVGVRIAPRFANCAVGDRIRFGQRDFTVVGHFGAGGSAYESEIWGDNPVLMPALQRDDVFQSVTFRMRDPARFPALKKELEADPRLQIQLKRESEFYAEQSGLLARVVLPLGVFITIIMAVGAMFGAMNTMYAAVGARAREIATLLVLGFSPLAVLVSFVFESMFLALIGGAIGCLIALPLNGITTSTTNFQSFSEVAFAFRITPGALAAGMAFAAVMGLVGGFLPSLRAARQSIAISLRA
ncbi:MAG TPA: ABC transporter permease [Candidatus Eisenbacteria bacterium]|jgi:ABC-type lipoprotein release transport system permease subunit